MSTRKQNRRKIVKAAAMPGAPSAAELALSAHKRITEMQGEMNSIKFNQVTAPRDIAKEASALVGLWVSKQIAAGQTAIDADRLRYVREGIEIALS